MSNRGPIEITSVSTALPYTPPILWIQVISAGSGGLVVVDDNGESRTYTGLLAGDPPLVGPFRQITSMTLAKIRVGDSVPVPAASPASSLAELYTTAQSAQAQVNVPLASAILAAGTPMAAWANNASSNPGITLADSKAVALRWNDNTTSTAVWFNVALPQDLDDTAAIVLHFMTSKSGATLADATTWTVTAFFQTAAALHDADTDCGGVSSALVGDATAKTVTELTLSIAAGDVPPAPCALAFSVKPTGAVCTTDDVILSGLWIEYKRKILTA